MKRLSTLIVLVGLTVGILLTGCNKAEEPAPTPPAGTNAPGSTN